jgi:hypothetical protein
MITFLRRSAFFLVLAILLDQGIGLCLGLLYRKTYTGESGGLINGALRTDADVLILGSSRAKHHISPAVLFEQIPGRIYNGGINGQDFLYSAMLLDLWTREHAAPRIIVLHVDPKSFAYSEMEIQTTIVFSAYFDRSDRVREVLLMRSPFERLKYLSRSFRYNGKVLPIFKNLLSPASLEGGGFVALVGALPPAQEGVGVRPPPPEPAEPNWPKKVQYLSELVDYCRKCGTRLFLVHSPTYSVGGSDRSAWIAQMKTLAAGYGDVEFLDLSEGAYPERFAGRPDLFKDGAHLNSAGAIEYSRLLAEVLAQRMASPAPKPSRASGGG